MMEASNRLAFRRALRDAAARPFVAERDLVHGSPQQRERHRRARTALLDRLRLDARVRTAYDAFSAQLGISTIRDRVIEYLDELAVEIGLRSRWDLFDPTTATPLDAAARVRRDALHTCFLTALDQQTKPVVEIAATAATVFRPLLDSLHFPRWRWLGLELLSQFFDHQEALIKDARVTRRYQDVSLGALSDPVVQIRMPTGASRSAIDKAFREARDRARAVAAIERMPKGDDYVEERVAWFFRHYADAVKPAVLAREYAARNVARKRVNPSHGFITIGIAAARKWLALGDKPALTPSQERAYRAAVDSMVPDDDEDRPTKQDPPLT
jgi:hypothetical protein